MCKGPLFRTLSHDLTSADKVERQMARRLCLQNLHPYKRTRWGRQFYPVVMDPSGTPPSLPWNPRAGTLEGPFIPAVSSPMDA